MNSWTPKVPSAANDDQNTAKLALQDHNMLGDWVPLFGKMGAFECNPTETCLQLAWLSKTHLLGQKIELLDIAMTSILEISQILPVCKLEVNWLPERRVAGAVFRKILYYRVYT